MAGFAFAVEVQLSGLEDNDGLRKKIEAASLVWATQENETVQAQDILTAAQADYGRLIRTLYDAGHFGPSVRIRVDGREAAEIPPFAQPSKIRQVQIFVDPGPSFNFGKTLISPLAPETTLPEGFKTDRPASIDTLRKTAKAGVDGWRRQGHAKAEIKDQTLVANHRDSTFDADIRIDAGPKLSFGKVQIQSESKVSNERFREIAGIPVGQTYHPDDVDRALKRLRKTGVFRSVTIRESATINDDNSMDVTITAVDEKPRRIGFGAELESREGLTLTAFWIHRNLFGGAERLLLDAELGGIGSETGNLDYKIGANFTRPATFRSNTDLTAFAGLEHLDERLYDMSIGRLSGTLLRTNSDRLTTSVGLEFQYSDVQDDYGDRTMSNIFLPISAIWDWRDNSLNARSGSYLRATVSPFAGFDAAKDGVLVGADARTYFSLGDNLVLAGRVQIGSIAGPGLDETPPNILFLSGGSGTVRGQPYQSNYVTVGGKRSGGLSFFGASGEIRYGVTDAISAVAFVDSGFVGETSDFGGQGNWHSGAGLGVRYNTGLGPIRFDVAGPLSGPSSGPIQLYVGIGQAF